MPASISKVATQGDTGADRRSHLYNRRGILRRGICSHILFYRSCRLRPPCHRTNGLAGRLHLNEIPDTLRDDTVVQTVHSLDQFDLQRLILLLQIQAEGVEFFTVVADRMFTFLIIVSLLIVLV